MDGHWREGTNGKVYLEEKKGWAPGMEAASQLPAWWFHVINWQSSAHPTLFLYRGSWDYEPGIDQSESRLMDPQRLVDRRYHTPLTME